MQGTLYLLPNTLGNPDPGLTHPPAILSLLKEINVFIVEDIRNARRFLKKLDRSIHIDGLVFHELNEHTDPAEIPGYLVEVTGGHNAAVLSEAGVPGVADPGALLVRTAHEKGIRVVPLTGPSSILLSLMASGLNGQAFRFHGYLPVKRKERIKKIWHLEQEIYASGETQVFIEAPYRNEALFSDLLGTCKQETLICVAADLTMDSEFIRTFPVSVWRKKAVKLHKRPVVFLMGT